MQIKLFLLDNAYTPSFACHTANLQTVLIRFNYMSCIFAQGIIWSA